MLTIACCLVEGLVLGLGLVFGWFRLCTRIGTTFDCHCHTAPVSVNVCRLLLSCASSRFICFAEASFDRYNMRDTATRDRRSVIAD